MPANTAAIGIATATAAANAAVVAAANHAGSAPAIGGHTGLVFLAALGIVAVAAGVPILLYWWVKT